MLVDDDRDCIPVYHADALRQFPQHCALALTNYFYLAHQVKKKHP